MTLSTRKTHSFERPADPWELISEFGVSALVGMIEPNREELRRAQEREVATSHALTGAEYALGFEAYVIGRVFARAGVGFDPHTFIALRIIEASLDGPADPVDALTTLTDAGTVNRAVTLANGMLADGELLAGA